MAHDSKIRPLKETVALRLNFVVPDTVDSKYATHLTLQQDGGLFALGFYEVMQPVIIAPEGEVEAQLKALGSIPARCVARIILDPTRLVQLHKLIGDNLGRIPPEVLQHLQASAQGQSDA